MSVAHTSFEATTYLGASVNMLSSDNAVTSLFLAEDLIGSDAIIKDAAHKAILMNQVTNSRTLQAPFGSIQDVPQNVDVNDQQRIIQEGNRTFASGQDVSTALRVNAEFQAEYIGVKASASSSYNSTKQYSTSMQYAFRNKMITGYVVSFTELQNFVNQNMIDAAKALPPYNADQGGDLTQSTVDQYKAFFRAYGTHCVTQLGYGWRFQLEASMSNSTTVSFEDFKADVGVSYLGNSASTSIESSDKFKAFQQDTNTTIRAIGGSAPDVSNAEDNPAKLDSSAWSHNAGTKDDAGLTDVILQPLGWCLFKIGQPELGLKLDRALFDQVGAGIRQFSYGGSFLFYPVTTDNLTWSFKFPSPALGFIQPDGKVASSWTIAIDPKSNPLRGPMDPAGTVLIKCPPVATVSMQATATLHNFDSNDIPPVVPGFHLDASLRMASLKPLTQVQGLSDIPFPPIPAGKTIDFSFDFDLPVHGDSDAWWLNY